MLKTDKKNGKIFTIIVIALFSFTAGIAGDLIFRSYFYDNIYGFPLSGEINYSDSSYRGTNLIIPNAKKIVIEQNEMTRETIGKVSTNLVGLYKKKSTSTSAMIENYDLVSELAGQGSIVTSDGWILTLYKNFKDEKDLKNGFVVITSDKKIYSIDKAINDKFSGSYFVHIEANGLPVRSFSDPDSLRIGDSVVFVDLNGYALATPIIGFRERGNTVINSDNDIKKIFVANDQAKIFKGMFFYDLSGNLSGAVNNAGQPESIAVYMPSISSLLKFGTLRRAALGITYVNIENLSTGTNKKGDLVKSVAKGSPAEIAGIKEGMLITSVNGKQISKEYGLFEAVSGHSIGDSLAFTYLTQDNTSRDISIILREIKK
jgi:S1-C subfamily serine protease